MSFENIVVKRYEQLNEEIESEDGESEGDSEIESLQANETSSLSGMEISDDEDDGRINLPSDDDQNEVFLQTFKEVCSSLFKSILFV